MKKNLLALAALGAIAGAAQAQVTVYGSYDAGVRDLTNANAAGNSNLTMSSGGQYNSNRIGFSGTEDLGGGLKTIFNLETGFNSGTGALEEGALFGRRAIVGLTGNWGKFVLGREYTVAMETIGDYEPFHYQYTGIIPVIHNTTGVRNSNAIQYSGTFGAVTARAEYALGEVAGSISNGAEQAAGLTYSANGLTLGAAYTQKKPANFDDKHYTLGGTYTVGAASVALGYANDRQATATVDSTRKDAWGGVSYQVSPAVGLTAAYYDVKSSVGGGDGTQKQFIVGATYALSKRTNFYSELDHTRYGGISMPSGQTNQTGISVGINHLF